MRYIMYSVVLRYPLPFKLFVSLLKRFRNWNVNVFNHGFLPMNELQLQIFVFHRFSIDVSCGLI